jgi:hypothetical protein
LLALLQELHHTLCALVLWRIARGFRKMGLTAGPANF